jgi:pyruvate,water dikinase
VTTCALPSRLPAHATIVAREFGVPAVVGRGNATPRLPRPRVDGGRGTVELLPAGASH